MTSSTALRQRFRYVKTSDGTRLAWAGAMRRGTPATERAHRAMMELVGVAWGRDNPTFRQARDHGFTKPSESR